jgi:hypothetical protein
VARVLLCASVGLLLAVCGFAVGARSPTAAPKPKTKPNLRTTTTAQTTVPATTAVTTPTAPPAKRKRHRVAPVAASVPTSGGGFPTSAIAGVGLAALMIGGGAAGMFVNRGRR